MIELVLVDLDGGLFVVKKRRKFYFGLVVFANISSKILIASIYLLSELIKVAEFGLERPPFITSEDFGL